jgi:hypothetical protein
MTHNTTNVLIIGLALDRVQTLVSRAKHLSKCGDVRTSLFLVEEARHFAAQVDGGEDFLAMTYHRYFSDSFGVVFEQLHGDEELMFGGAP